MPKYKLSAPADIHRDAVLSDASAVRQPADYSKYRMLSRAYFVAAAIFLNTVLLLCFLFAAGEWWARKNYPKERSAVEVTEANQQGLYHPWAGFRNTPGYEHSLGNLPLAKINKYGWRGPEPQMARRTGVRRAIVLGDSVAFSSMGCREGVSLHGALVRALEKRTQEPWEVINMAVSGGFSSISLGTLAHEGIYFQPDAVVVLNGNNDTGVLFEPSNWITLGYGAFNHILYHSYQNIVAEMYDSRTGKISEKYGLLAVLKNSRLLEVLSWKYLTDAEMTLGPWMGKPITLDISVEERRRRLRPFIQNTEAMSFLANGAGAKFFMFLQPYLSLKDKVLGPQDQEAIKSVRKHSLAGLLEWMDEVFPLLREELSEAARQHPSIIFEDLSLMFSTEQAFLDTVHFRCDRFIASLGYELVAERMADRIVAELYAGKELPDWRALVGEDAPHNWNEVRYLAQNPDVGELVKSGAVSSGYAHYKSTGFFEGRQGGFPAWDEGAYLKANPDVRAAVERGDYPSGYAHYLAVGRDRGLWPGLRPHWTEEMYLALNPDVRGLIQKGEFASGEDHFARVGVHQNRWGGFSGWDEEGYLLYYQDVFNAVRDHVFSSGLAHFLLAHKAEGRQIKLGTYIPFK